MPVASGARTPPRADTPQDLEICVRAPLILATSATLALPAAMAAAEAPPVRGPVEIHVAMTGSDAALGSLAAPKRTVQAAVDAAGPGTIIKVHKGTYSGVVRIVTSGTQSAPITITNAGDGEAIITSEQEPDDCRSTKPSQRRTIKVEGASNWIFRGLTIINGAWVVGDRSDAAFTWHAQKVIAGNWQDRRKVPGRGVNDPAATPKVVPYLRQVTGKRKMVSSDRIGFYNNVIRGRGVYAALSNYGAFRDNKVSDIICGSGPALWVMTFSDHWSITGNDISKVAASGITHYMQEGIRIGTASNYNYVANNNVHDIEGDGRAINTDVDSSFNLIQFNKVNNVAIGFNDQMSGWGNVWQYNQVSNFRNLGFAIRLKDNTLAAPSMNTSAHSIVLRCNRALQPVGKAKSLGIGGVMKARISGNNFTTSWVSPPAVGYWAAYGNEFNGTAIAPTPVVTPATC